VPKPKTKPKMRTRDKTIAAALITSGFGVVAVVIGSILTAALSGHSNSAQQVPAKSPSPPQPTSQAIGSLNSYNSALALLENGNANAATRGVRDLGFMYFSVGPALRHRIIRTLADYVTTSGPPMPSVASSYGYCLTNPPPSYPARFADALKIIGERPASDIGQEVDLSNANLAYAVLDGGNFQNINFDNALMCRIISFGSSFQGATFSQADLRFAIIDQARNLTAEQLRSVYSLYKAELPRSVYVQKWIKNLTRRDPALGPGFG
jgi:hypothetical protein